MGKAPKDPLNARDCKSNNSSVLQPGPAPHNEPTAPSDTKTVTVLEPDARSRRTSTGPRTAIGKQRSSLNARTHGIFSKGLLVADESPREFRVLLEGLLDDLKPEGTLETLLVEKLAMILWRKARVMRAESAEIEDVIQFSGLDTHMAQKAEAWECARSGESKGGMLKYTSNPHVLGEALEMLRAVRFGLEKGGFQKDPWLLRKLYGLDHDEAAPWGAFNCYLALAQVAAENSKINPGTNDGDDLKKIMLKILDSEIERLERLAKAQKRLDEIRMPLKLNTALVPPPAVSERLLRYETHLSRELDRTLSQLERLQRMRLGKPVIPPINVQVS